MAHPKDAGARRASQSENDDHTVILKNALELCVASGDITMVEAEAVVVGEDTELSGRGAVAQRLTKVGGKEFLKNRKQLKNRMKETDFTSHVYSCPAGSKLKFDQVFHAMTTPKGGRSSIVQWDKHIKNLFLQIGILAENTGVETIATPLIGAGAAGGTVDESLEALVDGLSFYPFKNLRKIILVEYDARKASDMEQKLREVLDRKKKAAEVARRSMHHRVSRISGRRPHQVEGAGGNTDRNPDIDIDKRYSGQTKRIFKQQTGADDPEEGYIESVTQQIQADSLEEGKTVYPVSADRGQRKPNVCWDRGPEAPESLQEERPLSAPGGDTDHYAVFRFREQPREDPTVSHQRSPSSPDPAVDRGLPLDTSITVRCDGDTTTTGGHNEDTITTEGHIEDTSTIAGDTEDATSTGGHSRDTSTRGEHTEDQTRETALHTQPSDQDPGTESANPGQTKGKRDSAATVDGNTGSDSATAKSSERKTLKKTMGTMPRGRMTYSVKRGIHVPGYEGCGVILVDYIIPDGIQTSEQPKPGSPYCGCAKCAFLPDNGEGRRVLKLLEEAFDRRLTFQVCEPPGGQALVEWADIPHKTCLRGTRDRGGYPDPDYLGIVQNLLREKYGLE